MKRLVVLFMMAGVLLGVSCKKEALEASNPQFDALVTSSLGGQWKFKGYSDGKIPAYDVSLEFKNEEGKLAINGRSSVNFYFATTEIDEVKKTLKVVSLGTTKIGGDKDATDFEMNYYDRLRNVERYELKDKSELILYVSNPTKETLYFERK